MTDPMGGPCADEGPPLRPEGERRLQTICLLVLATVAVGAALHFLRDVMIPFALASFLALALSPVVDFLAAKTRLSRPISVGITMVLGTLVLAILGGVVASSISEYEATDFFEKLEETGEGEGGEIAEGADGTEASEKKPAEQSGGMLAAALEKLSIPKENIPVFVGKIEGALGDAVPRIVGTLGAILGQGITVLVFLLFLLVEQRKPPGAGSVSIGDTVRERVKKYVSVKTLTSAVTGILTGLILWAVGAPAPVLFGLLAFLLNFIPTIGSVIAVALPLPLLLADGAGVVTIVLALVLPGAVQFVIGQIWENKMFGAAFDLRASVVLLTLVFWGKIWGIVGMLLATPITAVLKTLMLEWEITRPLARAMGQGPPVEPGAATPAPVAVRPPEA